MSHAAMANNNMLITEARRKIRRYRIIGLVFRLILITSAGFIFGQHLAGTAPLVPLIHLSIVVLIISIIGYWVANEGMHAWHKYLVTCLEQQLRAPRTFHVVDPDEDHVEVA